VYLQTPTICVRLHRGATDLASNPDFDKKHTIAEDSAALITRTVVANPMRATDALEPTPGRSSIITFCDGSEVRKKRHSGNRIRGAFWKVLGVAAVSLSHAGPNVRKGSSPCENSNGRAAVDEFESVFGQ